MHRLSTTTVATAIAATLMVHQADSHIFQLSPTSRQVYNSPVFQEWPFQPMEYCPSCYNAMGPTHIKERAIANTDRSFLETYGGGEWPLLTAWERGELAENGNYLEPDEISVRHGVCGDPKQNSQEGTNTYSTPNHKWPILETFREGQVMDIKLVMRAYQRGHVEFFICNADEMEEPNGVPSQSCFNANPLTRATGDSSNSPIDINYPGRVDPECRAEETDQTKPEETQDGYVIHMRYQLPDGLTCTRCVMQMVYYTGNACKHPGYDEFNPPSWPSACAPEKKDWIEVNLDICGENESYPGEFWACSDFAITLDGLPNPTPAPTPPIPDCLDPIEPYEQMWKDGSSAPRRTTNQTDHQPADALKDDLGG